MTTVVWAGTIVGAFLGCLHAIYVYRVVAAEPAGHGRAGYHALWTFALWTVFGSYALALWLISVIAYAVAKAVGWRT
jgi:hypothetical protein